MAKCELGVIEPQQPQQRGVEVVNVNLLFYRLKSELVSSSVYVTPAHSAASEPHAKAVMVMVASVDLARVRTGRREFHCRRAAEFSTPNHQRFVEHAALLQIGQQRANLMFYTGRRIGGEEAHAWGMADVLVPLADVRKAAMGLAKEIAESAPLAVASTRETMRRGFADAAEIATERELVEQDWLRKTEDFKEGIKSYAEKRVGNWKRR